MPRRKGYGIPPTKRIKIENDQENDENEPKDGKSENTRIDVQKSDNGNCALEQTSANASENISNSLANATTNGSNKYLHKKFKKMVALLSDDCTPPSSAIEANNNEHESNRVAAAATTAVKEPCHVTTSSAFAAAATATTTTTAAAAAAENHHASINTVITTAATATTAMQSSLPKFASSRMDGRNGAATTEAGNQLNANRDYHSGGHHKSTSGNLHGNVVNSMTPAMASEEDNVTTVAAKCVCPYCELVCSKPSVLEKHLRAHTNERPYPCLPCGFSFKTRSNLLKHCRTSRSHSLKLEEAGVDANASMKTLEEENEEPEEEAQTCGVANKDESSCDETRPENAPRSIYKPKFHKAAIYIQNNNAAAMSSSKSEPSTINKLGLQLKIPSTTASATQHNSSTPSTPSPFTSGSSPSPEFLHRHISKLISENQAIVETTDPFWSKKFYQRKEGSPSSPLSTSSSSSLDSYKKIPTSVKQEPQCIEDKLPVESKLAHALLQPRVVKAATAAVPLNNGNGPADGNATLEDAQPLNLTICKDTRAKSYLDEDDDKAPPAAEYRVIANDAAARFMPNGRIAADVYVKDAHHGFVKADNAILATKSKLPIIEHMCSLCDETFDNYDKLKTHILFRCKGNKNHSLSSTRPSSNDTTPFRGTEPLSSLVAAVANVNPAKNLPNQSLGPRLGNTPLVGNYTKLSVITPLAGSGGSSSADKPKNAPSLIQAVPVPSLLTVTTNSDIRLSPVAAAYKVGAPPPSPSSLTKSKPTHVNGGVVTILHGGKVIPYVPGMPGPQSVSAVPAFMQVDGYEKKTSEAVKRKFEDNAPPNGIIKHANQRIDDISVQAAKIVHGVKIKEEASSAIYLDQEKESSCSGKFVRPSSLPLKPGTFVPKKLQPGTSSVLPLISPETPRPNKSYGQLYIGGNAYTYLGLKCSTRSTFCTLHKSQPTYVPLSPEHNKVSMYSNWKIRSDVDPYLRGVPPTKAMSCYDSRQRYSSFTVVHTKMKDAVTHSSYWFRRSKTRVDHDTNQCYDNENKDIQISPQNEIYTKNEDGSRNNKICLGGIESTDDYTYIRGQGRGKYVCLKCGIRCKKPSMLKKHIRTHTDVRPYICKHCVFRFKTKGNLTKHMKSKAHYKKCIELGIVPVPTIVDDSYVDEDVLSKQTQQIEEGQDIEETEEEDDDDEDDDDDENEDDYIEDKEAVEDPKCQLEREVARSLLSLSKMSHQTVSEQYANAGLVPLNARPNTYPYNFSANPHLSSKPHTPTLTLISEQKEQEKVSKNTGLARELQPTITPNQLIKSKNESYSNERYYFGSVVDKEIVAMETNEIQEPAKESIVRNHFVEQRCVGGMNAKIEVPDRNSDSDTKENLIITSLSDGEKAESSTSVIISIGSPNSNLSTNSPKKLKAEFISPCNGPLTKYASVLEDGRSKCAICNKIFSKQSQLRLHVNIHYFEQPFRCESCAVSFRTRNNLQKHLGSNSHLNKVSMNSAAGGQTSTNNPRPFKCDDCNIGFRIHGHLAKHLRSKMHIMKLECLGKLPFGTYAEMERCGINMNDIDTTDCENSLESLQRIAKGVVNSVMYVNNAEDENKMSTDSSC